MTDDWAEPRDEQAERVLVGTLMQQQTVPAEVSNLVRPDDWWHPALRLVAEACWDLTAQAKPCDPISVRAELLRRGQRGQATDGAWLLEHTLHAFGGAATAHARLLRSLSIRRELMTAARRALQSAGSPEADAHEIAAALSVQAGALAEHDESTPSAAIDSEQFCDGPMDYDWLVPGLLERGDRVLFTGGEGGGKSVLVRQIAVAVACGVHPFTGTRFEPKRVTLVDLENGERTLRRHLIRLRTHAAKIGRPVPLRGLMVESVPSGVDLTRPDGEAWLSRLCEDTRPELLVIGPLYRMHATDMNKEEPARHLTRVVDMMRARHRCCVVMETHAPHAGIGPRSMRPIGSSLYMRWPEFGYGIKPTKEEGVFQLVPWRGPRDEREWPTDLRWGGPDEWSWMPYNPHAGNVERFWSEEVS